MKQQDQDLLRDISHFISVSADHLPNDLRTYALALQVRTSLTLTGLNYDHIFHPRTGVCSEEVEFFEDSSEAPS